MSGGVVVVGAGLGGVRVAEALRRAGRIGPITLLGAETHPPYDRPPLSKTVLTGQDERVDLKPDEYFAGADITVQTSSRVVELDASARRVRVARSEGTVDEIAYDTLVLATGIVARRFAGPGGDLSGVHVVRTVDDALALRDEAAAASRAVVIGAGFIGCEVAASLVGRGLAVTVVEPAATPLAGALGEQVGALVARLHVAAGVDLRTGVGVDRLTGVDGRVTAVELSDGSSVPADLVVVGIGGYPEVEWLADSGIDLADRESGGGIACDASGRTSVADVYALGDVANWIDAQGDRRRVEHWNHTVDQSAVVAASILGAEPPAPAVPYFWSDQHGLKIQMLGAPRPDDDVHLVDDDGRKFLAYYSRDGVLTGVVGAGRAGKVMKTRPLLAVPTPVVELLGG